MFRATPELTRCCEALADPSQARRKICEIAFGRGFNDLTHFGKALFPLCCESRWLHGDKAALIQYEQAGGDIHNASPTIITRGTHGRRPLGTSTQIALSGNEVEGKGELTQGKEERS